MATGTLYFIPVTVADDTTPQQVLSSDVIAKIHQLQHFIVENEKTARQFLAACGHPTTMRDITLKVLNKDTTAKELNALLQPVQKGIDVGLMSEAGCPGIADPGAVLAALAHHKGVRVAPLIGPSSLLLGLMASGLNGQRFRFLGYLPVDKLTRIEKIKQIEQESKKHHETQLFIETPYRNQHLLQDIIDTLHPQTRLCIACHVTSQDELIATKTVAEWQQTQLPDLYKKPTVFLMLA